MKRLLKQAQQGLSGTSTIETVKSLGAQVKDLLDKLTPMMQGFQQAVPQLNTAMQNIKQLEQQVASMEQAQAEVQQVVRQQSDDGQQTRVKPERSVFETVTKDYAGPAWAKVVQTLGGGGKHIDNLGENAVSGVRGGAPLPGVVKESKIKDRLPGGEADNVSEDKVNKKQLDMGQKVEMEHTDDPEIAREIARDHLAEELKDGKKKEDQEYYTKLKQVHEDKCNDSVPAFWRRNLDYGSL